MAQTQIHKEPETAPYVVLRAICMQGQRVEVGATVMMTRTLATDAMAAGKVAPAPPASATPAKSVRAPKPGKAADPTPTTDEAAP